ncbi:MAG: hypothetical protein HC851_03100 [Acaryochloris sp. RU_4_1]|nr:hypothetical protein [Acaryochloris sp. SU_5_25]NJM64710.1 hypothetical protein [Acaryochloris sp. RU_4_1]NJN37857.1 hypothetical protein [Acaryochloridaceae cyanobacterium CSU_3_4]NJR53931.1 hypothetical protein [Acaryochloris sp. CRU_2_0]
MASDPETKTTSAKPTVDLDVNSEMSGNLSRLSSNDSTAINVKEIGEKLRDFVDVFPKQFGETFEIYQKPLTTGAIILTALVSVAVADGVLDVLNAIPLVAPLLELIGLGYSVWFAWHYLRYAESRQQLLTNYRQLKQRITGSGD